MAVGGVCNAGQLPSAPSCYASISPQSGFAASGWVSSGSPLRRVPKRNRPQEPSCSKTSCRQPRRDHPSLSGQSRHQMSARRQRSREPLRRSPFSRSAHRCPAPGVRSNPEIGKSAVHHGLELLQRGFTVSQVVHDYGDVCQSITELAVERDTPISTADFRTLNQCLDEAIAGAVTEYGRERSQSSHDDATMEGTERLGFFAHELRNLVNTASLSYEVLKTGNVGHRRQHRRRPRPHSRRTAYTHQPFARRSPTEARDPESRADFAPGIRRRRDGHGAAGRPCPRCAADGRARRGRR